MVHMNLIGLFLVKKCIETDLYLISTIPYDSRVCTSCIIMSD